MPNALRRASALSSLLIAIAIAPSLAFAQSGSAGGSIGNEDKSLSGSRQDRSAEPAPSSRKSTPAADEQRSSSRRGGGGGGGGNFDGAWVVVSVGCGSSSTEAVVVTSGKIIGQGLTGNVSPSGVARSVRHYNNGVTVNSSGRVSGRSGSGTFRSSDGCSGTWTSTKQ